MTTVGTLSSDLGPGNSNITGNASMAADDNTKTEKLITGSVDDTGSMKFIQACSKLDMEPNPFEQSFSGSASGSGAEPSSETPKPVLPPIASMSGRLAPNNDQFGWDEPSLRMGPLSPSMLEGPQDPIMFDKPATTSLPMSTSYPTTTAPISTIYTSGAPIAESGFPFVGMPANGAQMIQAPAGGPIPTTEPYPPVVYNQQTSVSQMPPQHGAPAQPRGSFSHASMNERYMVQQGGQQADNANGYGNLHLLSQAQATHREMWIKRESVDGNGHMPQQGHLHQAQGGQAMSGMHPGMMASQSSSRGAAQRNRMTSEDNSDDSEISKQSSNGGGERSSKKRSASDDKMDEEEKRKNFLERNRQAALKCRQRKKQWLSNLQAKVEYLTTDNEHLQTQTASLRDEIIHLKALLLAHKECPVAQANGVYADTISVPGGGHNHNHGHNHSGGMLAHGGRGGPHGMQQGPPGPGSQQPSSQQQRGGAPNGPRGSLPAQMQTGGARMSISSTAATAGSAVSSGSVNGQPSIRY
ncbi:hypothetical protein EDD11_000311 [Mortierella claussenii]|nr:hypothetical protein EDD11_000311 [Mortierella claussenii]